MIIEKEGVQPEDRLGVNWWTLVTQGMTVSILFLRKHKRGWISRTAKIDFIPKAGKEDKRFQAYKTHILYTEDLKTNLGIGNKEQTGESYF